MKKITVSLIALLVLASTGFSQQKSDEQFYRVVKNLVLDYRSGDKEKALTGAHELVVLLSELNGLSISLGTSKNDILAVLGTPTRVTNWSNTTQCWWYGGGSYLVLKNGKLANYSNYGNLPIRLLPEVPPTAQNVANQTVISTAKTATPSKFTTYFPTNSTYKPPVAENGSYYGEISKLTGRPKTVHVKGYYRKDGTYVRGHYRSRPRK